MEPYTELEAPIEYEGKEYFFQIAKQTRIVGKKPAFMATPIVVTMDEEDAMRAVGSGVRMAHGAISRAVDEVLQTSAHIGESVRSAVQDLAKAQMQTGIETMASELAKAAAKNLVAAHIHGDDDTGDKEPEGGTANAGANTPAAKAAQQPQFTPANAAAGGSLRKRSAGHDSDRRAKGLKSGEGTSAPSSPAPGDVGEDDM